MSRSLGLTVVLYSIALAVVCAGSAVLSPRRPPSVAVALALLELATIGQAGLDALALVRGRHGPDVATNLGYLLTSVTILPIAAASVRLDPGRWGSVALAVGCLVLAVVSVRLQQTLASAHA